MYKLTSLILVALSLVACGGEPFGADSADIEQIGGADSVAVAGEAGSAVAGDAGESYGGTASGGSASAAGRPPVGGSAPQAGTSMGGSSNAGSGTGGTQATCEFDEAKLAAALPQSFVWEGFTYTSGEFCGRCRDMPCETINVISWGVATMDDGGGYVYSPNADAPMVTMSLGANDGVCAAEKSCGLKLHLGSIRLTVEQTASGWKIATATAYSQSEGNACLDSYPGGGSITSTATADFAKEVEKVLVGREIPCD